MTSEEDGEGGFERWVRPFLDDSMLWPVTLVAIVIALTLGAMLWALAVGDGNRFAMAALGVLALVSLELLVRMVRRGRIGLGAVALLSWWLLSAAVALAAVRAGLF